jgi:hypothetical protein
MAADAADALERIRSEFEAFGASGGAFARLLAAVEAVLALHQPARFIVLGVVCETHEAYPHFSITSIEAQHVRACPDCKATVSVSCTCGHADIDYCPHRLAVTRELLGEGDGHASP